MADILVVDDDQDLGELLAAFLDADGHRTRLARDGMEGLSLVAEHRPDVVLADVEMPVLTGPEMSLRMFVNDMGQEEIPIVLLSGIVNLSRVAAMVGTPYYLSKPYEIADVLALVARALVERQPPVPVLSMIVGPSLSR